MGENSKIGAGSVVLKEVPAHSTVVGIPGRVVIQNGVKIGQELNHSDLPDPIFDKLKAMEVELDKLKKQLELKVERKDKMTIHIYNTLTRQKEEFVPLEENKVKMYVCDLQFITTFILGMQDLLWYSIQCVVI